MDPRVRSLLYREPRLYDLAFPDAAENELAMCHAAFARFGPLGPRSVLDLGCGTAKNLAWLARTILECWGVDYLEANIAYARSVRPGLTLRVGDMREVRLGHAFDVVTCFGNALSYALTDADLARVAATFAAHARPGTLLMVDALNARAYLDGQGFEARIEGAVTTPEFTATSVSTHTLDRARRILTRTRVWRIPGEPDVEDYAPALSRGAATPRRRRRIRGARDPRTASSASPASPARSPPPPTWRACVAASSSSSPQPRAAEVAWPRGGIRRAGTMSGRTGPIRLTVSAVTTSS